ncbi:uncharacterized protein LOC126344437 [Schistocerca gregaria]|uniref:uncharacterized protein LOC126344437 n=1 Tax=Schistocerca gregaria TaxID=7010 RepID=UPI00211E0C3A|nr:uncharacterized protein LOC126344437 [Schistocerca gregaria]XP_049857977.1 uncharacterized protein LOC126344437 [Schistocerca gregaria]
MDPEDRLDEDFMFYLSVSERNWKNLQNEKDKELGQEWLYKLTALQQTKADKRDRNVYLSQLALAMGDGELSGPFLKRPPEGNLPAPSDVFGPPQPRIEVPPEFKKIDKTEDLTTTYTSKDGRTYVATKSLGKDHGAYTYIGISLADKEPLWVGGDAPTGPCYGFERHFERPQTLYSKPRPRPPSTIFAMEQEGGGGDSPDDTKIFTDYVTGAKDAQMSGTHGKDFQPQTAEVVDKELRLPDAPQKDGQRKSVAPSAIKSEDAAEKAKRAGDAPGEKQVPAPNQWEGLDIMFPLPKEGDTATTNTQLDISEFYTAMITNINNTLSGKDELNDYNKEKADEIRRRYARANNKLQLFEVLNKTKEALVKKLMRVKEEESRFTDSIKKIEFTLLSNTIDSEDSVFETAWKEACKVHNKKNLQLLEQVYNPAVRERMADMMTLLKSRAMHDRSKHMKAQAAAAREDFKLQTERLQAKVKVAEDLMNRIQGVIDEAELLRTAAPTESPYAAQRRELADRLLSDVEQLTNMYHVEYTACRSLEKEIENTSDNIFSHPEFTSIGMDNMRLKTGIAAMQARLRAK